MFVFGCWSFLLVSFFIDGVEFKLVGGFCFRVVGCLYCCWVGSDVVVLICCLVLGGFGMFLFFLFLVGVMIVNVNDSCMLF